ncbi:MAG: TetR/AcrR family transcriptional regulator C-terminal domain-containing protein [Lachnospiraceae bacterium]|nr:TetR/AcrR family transcriptional regulator C-terminal domain-containing protein [Lachnospiraceae bacterium]
MSEKKVDRRVRKTKKVLLDCLTELLKKKSINEISVKELTDLADINRGTFYLHYKDVYDMLHKVEDEVFDNFNEMINHYSADILLEDASPLFEDIFCFASENSGLCTLFLGENGDISFLNQLLSLLRDRCFQNWRESFHAKDTKHFDYFFAFLSGGCIVLIRNWLDNAMKESPHEMAVLTNRFLTEGIRCLNS